MTIYEKFLRMLDFSDEGMGSVLPRWENTCKLLGLSEEDVRYAAEDWIPVYWDMSLHGVRKCIGAYIRELIEMSRLPEYKAQGAKILYCNMPSHPASVYANKYAAGEGLHISYPDFLIASVLSAFFHKSTFLAGGDASCMNPQYNHCGMNRLRAAARIKNIIVSPTVVWNWGLYCNEGPKTEELIECIGNGDWQYILTFLPHDVLFGTCEARDEKRVHYLARQLKESQKMISEITGYPVTDDDLRRASAGVLRYTNKL